MKKDNNFCPICKSSTYKFSKSTYIDKNTKLDWVSDSTFNLSGLKSVNVQLRTCLKCCHSFLSPKFDTSLLYVNDKGYKERCKQRKIYFPDANYLELNSSKKGGKILFEDVAKELERFRKISLTISKLVKGIDLPNQEFRILDWGGGDGYVSAIYASLIKGITGKKSENVIYDYSKWRNIGDSKFIRKKKEVYKKFDIIILSHVLEHTYDPIKEIKTTLKYATKNCIFIIEVPDERHNLIMGALGKRFGMNYHVSTFTRSSLLKLLKICNIKSVITKYNFNSSYRGQICDVISCVGILNGPNNNNFSNQNIASEALSTLLVTLKKIIRKIIRKIINKIN
mgnify:FL=1|tara:strand:+ start:948 stop:1964 length:1017 start_codon:yes stop_codon:yes gene_type:complete